MSIAITVGIVLLIVGSLWQALTPNSGGYFGGKESHGGCAVAALGLLILFVLLLMWLGKAVL